MSGKSRRDFLKKSAVIGAGIVGLSISTLKASLKNMLSEDKKILNTKRRPNYTKLTCVN